MPDDFWREVRELRQWRRQVRGVKEDFDARYAAHRPRNWTERLRMWLAKALMEATDFQSRRAERLTEKAARVKQRSEDDDLIY